MQENRRTDLILQDINGVRLVTKDTGGSGLNMQDIWGGVGLVIQDSSGAGFGPDCPGLRWRVSCTSVPDYSGH
jgi:hypothetical protein